MSLTPIAMFKPKPLSRIRLDRLFLLRGNNLNPHWPKTPDPDDVVFVRYNGELDKRPISQQEALVTTRARVAAKTRQGAGGITDNLDWLAMVRTLRQKKYQDGRTFVWVGESCPNLPKPIWVTACFRYGAFGRDGLRYCFTTFKTLNVSGSIY